MIINTTMIYEGTQKPNLELRMYALVHRSLSPIQKGIQAGHAFIEYQRELKFENSEINDNYNVWSTYHKTMVLLDGGSHDELMAHYDRLKSEFNVYVTYFREPDLNGCITAIAFLLDERIFNDKKYPDFAPPVPVPVQPSESPIPTSGSIEIMPSIYRPFDFPAFIESIGGQKNYELRKFVKSFRLAI